jgi:hypothetical protein
MLKLTKDALNAWRTILSYVILSILFGFIDLPVDKFNLAYKWQFQELAPFQVANVVWILLTLGSVSSIYNHLYFGVKRSRTILIELFLIFIFCFLTALSTSSINQPPITPNESIIFAIIGLRLFTANRHRGQELTKEEVR